MECSTRWGQASCRRAFVASALIVFLLLTTYSNRPRDTVTLVFVWPIVLTFCGLGIGYGVIGLRREHRRRAALVGLILNAMLVIPATFGTVDAAREVIVAYRHHNGVIIMPDR